MKKYLNLEAALTAAVVVCACAMVYMSVSLATIASPPVDAPIILPKEVVAIETNKEQLFNRDAQCFHLVKAKDGTPDYVLGACPD